MDVKDTQSQSRQMIYFDGDRPRRSKSASSRIEKLKMDILRRKVIRETQWKKRRRLMQDTLKRAKEKDNPHGLLQIHKESMNGIQKEVELDASD